MTILGFNHVGVVVRDLEGAARFFRALGFEVNGPQQVEGVWLRRVAGVEADHSELYGVSAPGDEPWLELVRYSPATEEQPVALPSDALGYRHIAYQVTDVDELVRTARAEGYEPVAEPVDYGDAYRLVYLRGPEGLIVELAQPLSNPF